MAATKTNTTQAYTSMLLYCLLSSLRDALWGKYLQIGSPLVSASYALLSGCLVTIFIAATFGVTSRQISIDKLRRFSYPGGWQDFFIINVATVGAYYAYLLAVASPIGPGLTCFVDYALNPLSTMAMAVLVLGVKWNRSLLLSLLFAMGGIVLFFVPRLSAQLTIDNRFLMGIGFALTSALLGGVFKVYSKKALENGLGKMEVLFGRLVVLTIVLATHVLMVRASLTGNQVLALIAWGFFGFFLPLLLFLRVIERLSMDSIVLLSFSIPLLSYLFSALLGLQKILPLDTVAAALVFLAVYFHETRRRAAIVSEPPLG